MKEKSQIEKKAEARQAELLSAALGGASNAGGLYFGNSPVSVGYRLVSNKGSTLLSQIQMLSPLTAHSLQSAPFWVPVS